MQYWRILTLTRPLKSKPDYKDASANAKNSVIPAWMPESRAMDGDYPWHPYPI